jgi:hypothetical protein
MALAFLQWEAFLKSTICKNNGKASVFQWLLVVAEPSLACRQGFGCGGGLFFAAPPSILLAGSSWLAAIRKKSAAGLRQSLAQPGLQRFLQAKPVFSARMRPSFCL